MSNELKEKISNLVNYYDYHSMDKFVNGNDEALKQYRVIGTIKQRIGGINKMSEVYNSLNYLVKRELSTDELRAMIEDLQLTVHVRENVPF